MLKRLVTRFLIALAAATCIPTLVHAEPPGHFRGGHGSYSEHQHRPYYYRRYYYAPVDGGHPTHGRMPFRPHR
jgi:hypothetical protein